MNGGTEAGGAAEYRYFLQAKRPGIGFIVFLSLIPAAGTLGLPVWIYAAVWFAVEGEMTILAVSVAMAVVCILFMLLWFPVRRRARRLRQRGWWGIGFTQDSFIVSLDNDDSITIPAAGISQIKGYPAGRDYRGVGVCYRDASGKDKELFITWSSFDLSVDELRSWIQERLALIRVSLR